MKRTNVLKGKSIEVSDEPNGKTTKSTTKVSSKNKTSTKKTTKKSESKPSESTDKPKRNTVKSVNKASSKTSAKKTTKKSESKSKDKQCGMSKRPSAPKTKTVSIGRVIDTSNSVMGSIDYDRKTNLYTFKSKTGFKLSDSDITKLENMMISRDAKFLSIKYELHYDRKEKKLL